MQPLTRITILGFRLGVVVLTVYWLTIFTGTHLPPAADVSPGVNDKLKHFVAFLLLGLQLCYVTTSPRSVRRFGAILVVGVAYAAFDEWTQGLIPGRQPDPRDFLTDVAALVTAVALYAAGSRLLRKSG